MKRILLALLFFAGTTLAMATMEKTAGTGKSITASIQVPPRPVPPPPPHRLRHHHSRIEARRDADVRSAKSALHRAGQRTKHAIQSIPPPPPPPRR